MGVICITNNTMLYEKYKGKLKIEILDVSLKEVMLKVRDMVHEGHKILTHPLSGSVKPNETTVKTIFVTDTKGSLDTESLVLIENSIMAVDKFVKRDINYKNCKEDFEVVDMGLAESAMASMLSF